MRKNICLFLIICVLMEIPAIASVPSKVLEGGKIVWSGEVELTSSVLVPEGSTLIIAPGTKINCVYVYNDKKFSPEEWKIIVEGNLVASGEVIFDSMPHGLSSVRIPIPSNIENITISPQKIETQEIRREFSKFRNQYLILWSLLFAGIYYAIKTRKD